MINKKKLLITIIPIFIIGTVLFTKPISKIIEVKSNTYGTPANSSFTDENFYKCVVDAYNKENNTSLGYNVSLTDEQLETITSVKCDGAGKESNERINNTSGLEKLTSITNLDLYANQISSIDLSRNRNLKNLELSFNQLTIIDLSKNTSLTSLHLTNNQLTSIDISKNTSLTFLYLDWNQLTNIDLSNNTLLTVAGLSNNQLTDIDISQNTNLTDLSAVSNQLTSIDISKNTKLRELGLGSNQLANIDLSKNSSIMKLVLDHNQLTDIDVSQNTNLTRLDLGSNLLTSIDINNNTNLTQLHLDSNQLTNIDLSKNIDLTSLGLSSNKLINIDLSQNNNLIYLNLSNNQLTSIDLNKKTNLTQLHLDSNQITSIDLSKNIDLTTLDLGNNKLTNIDLSHNTNLTFLSLSNNELTNINLSYNKNLTFKSIYNQNKKYTIYKNDLSKISEQELINEIRNDTSKTKFTIVYTYIDTDDSEDEYNFDYYITWIEATSDKYIIDENDNYIYTGTDIDNETILQNISLTEYDGVTGNIQNNKYIIKKNDEILKEFDLININSIKYDLSKQYLIGDVADIINNITVANGSIEFSVVKNMFQVKHNDDILQEYGYVNYSSNKYDLSKNYIKVNDADIQSLLSNINCINCNAYAYDGTNNLITGNFADNYTLRIMYNDEILKEYELKYSVSGVSLNTNNLKLNLDTKKTYNLIANITPTNSENKNVTWESSNPSVATVDENGLVTAIGLGEATITVKTEDGEFIDTCNAVVSEITTYTVTFKDGDNTYTSEFEENEDIVFKTDLEKTGYKLVGWKYNNQEYKLTDKLSMPSENIELTAIWELVIPEVKNYESDDNNITGISLKTDINNINLGIDSIYQVKVSKHDGTDKTTGLIGTGDKVKIYLDNELVSEYDVIIKGDVTGTGTSTVSDVAKLYQYLKGKVKMDDCYVKAGNVVDSDSTIKVNDVAKLYQFIKGKINSL